MWLDILDRLLWLMLGMAIGASLGWATRDRRRVDHLEHIIEPETHPHDPLAPKPGPHGRLIAASRTRKDTRVIPVPTIRRHGRLVTNVQMFVVVLMTVWAALSASLALGQVQEESRRQTAVLECSRTTLERTIAVLDERSRLSEIQSQANIRLQRAQAEYLQSAQRINRSDPEVWQSELWEYRQALNEYIRTTEKILNATTPTTYPDVSEYTACVRTAEQAATEE